LDQTAIIRLDVDADGGTTSNPAATFSIGAILLFSEEFEEQRWSLARDEETNYLEESATSIAVGLSGSLDVEQQRIDATMGAADYPTDWKVQNGITFTGTQFEHELTNLTTQFNAALDVKAGTSTGAINFDLLSMTKKFIGMAGQNYDWEDSTSVSDFRQAAVAAMPETLQRLDELRAGRGRLLRMLTGFQRRLQQYEDITSTGLGVGLKWDLAMFGTGQGDNIFHASVDVNTAGLLNANVSTSIEVDETEVALYKITGVVAVTFELALPVYELFLSTLTPGETTRLMIDDLETPTLFETQVTLTGDITVDGRQDPRATVTSGGSMLLGCRHLDATTQAILGMSASNASDPRCLVCEGDPSEYLDWSMNSNQMMVTSRCTNGISKSCCFRVVDLLLEGVGMTVDEVSFHRIGVTQNIQTIDVDVERVSGGPGDALGWLQSSVSFPNRSDMPAITATQTEGQAGTTTTQWNLTMHGAILAAAEMTQVDVVNGIDITLTASTFGETLGTVRYMEDETQRQMSVEDRQMLNVKAEVDFKKTYNGEDGFKTGIIVMQNGTLITDQHIGFLSQPTLTKVDGHMKLTNDDNQLDEYNMDTTLTEVPGKTTLLANVNDGFLIAQMSAQEEPNVVSLTGNLQNEGQELGQVIASARQSDGGDLTATATVSTGDGPLAKLVASFTKTSATGVANADLDLIGDDMADIAGTMQKDGKFFVGDLTVDVPLLELSQVVWANVSDGYLAAPARNGLDGFQRMYTEVGAGIDFLQVQVNASLYWEMPPNDDFVCNVGVEVDVDSVTGGKLTDLSYTKVDVALPYSASGNAANVVLVEKQEVRQTVTADLS